MLRHVTRNLMQIIVFENKYYQQFKNKDLIPSMNFLECRYLFVFFNLVTLFRVAFYRQATSQQLIYVIWNLSSLSGFTQYLIKFRSLCWITGCHTIHPVFENCFPQLVLNLHHSEIWPPKYLDYWRMPLHPEKL